MQNDQNLQDSQIKKPTGASEDIQQLSVTNQDSSGSFTKHFTGKDFDKVKENAKEQLSSFEKKRKVCYLMWLDYATLLKHSNPEWSACCLTLYLRVN